MTREQNIRAILECNFSGMKDEIIDAAVRNIMLLDGKSSAKVKSASLIDITAEIAGLTYHFFDSDAYVKVNEVYNILDEYEKTDGSKKEWNVDEYGIKHCPECNAINNTVYDSFCPNCGEELR